VLYCLSSSVTDLYLLELSHRAPLACWLRFSRYLVRRV
jgi:hypothetical protein